MSPDQDLLSDFVRNGSEHAFEALVHRHLAMVFHAALRRVGGDAHAANDVTQKVFTDLARKAPRLLDHPNLAGWLHRGTRFAAAEFVRGERRRRQRELEAQAMKLNEADASPEVATTGLIDAILDGLSAKDRTALVMHFFEDRTFIEVGEALAISADAARMRVNRALDKAGNLLRRQGVSSSAAMLAAALSSAKASATPLPSAHTISQSAIATATAGGAAAVSMLKIAFWIAGGLAVTGVSVGVWIGRTPSPAAPSGNSTLLDKGSEQSQATAVAARPAGGREPSPVAKAEIASLDPAERRILRQLWSAELRRGVQPDLRAGIKFGDGSLLGLETRQLNATGLTYTNRNGGTTLTPRGIAFCRAQFGTGGMDAPPSTDP